MSAKVLKSSIYFIQPFKSPDLEISAKIKYFQLERNSTEMYFVSDKMNLIVQYSFGLYSNLFLGTMLYSCVFQ